MWSWFGGGSAANRKDSPKNAILGLRSQLDMLQKREKHLQNQIEEQNALARKHVGSNNTNGKFSVSMPGEAFVRTGEMEQNKKS
jgi:charged multivesicular body protein 4